MSSQLVDINADNKKDILVGSFSGVPHIIMGDEKGYAVPEAMKDSSGETILIANFWNTKDSKWDKTDRAKSKGHCTSVAAVDWDSDGDLDLILGDYYGGALFVRMNEGSDSEPKYATENAAILAAGKPIVIEKGLAAPRVVDWNGDGLFDIICGGAKGGAFLYLNNGNKSEPKFQAAQTLIKPYEDKKNSYVKLVPSKNDLPTMAGSSFHIEPVDYDNDGDLDLLVGARCSWKKADAPKLSDEDKAELEKIDAEWKVVIADYSAMLNGVAKKEDQKKVMESKEFKALSKKLTDLSHKKSKYNVNPNKSGDFVWLYRRK